MTAASRRETPADDSGPIDPPQMRRSGDRESTRDARLDRLTTWALTTVAGLALGLGAYFYSQLTGGVRDVVIEVRATREALSAIGTRVSLLEAARAAERLEERVRDNDRRITTLEAQRNAGGNKP